MSKPHLIVLVGIPGSGKSYFAKQLAPQMGAVRLNGDSMKTSMYGSYGYISENELISEANRRGFAALDYAAEEILRAGYSVVYDANNNRRRTRDKLRALARRYNAVPVVVWMEIPKDVARERITSRKETIDQPVFDAALFEKVFKIQDANLDKPTIDENLIRIDGLASFEEQFKTFDQFTTNLTKILKIKKTPTK